ncbi:hypothetical protein BgiBS90_003267 [Biomphalaria glabrata]|nr:hypothetical protein BgiBS90_003267 [Biomphalaria glabrata]
MTTNNNSCTIVRRGVYISKSGLELRPTDLLTQDSLQSSNMDSFTQVIILAVLVVLTTAQTNETFANSTTGQDKPLACLKADGLTANWQDETCSSYFVCDNFILRIVHCEEGKAFSLLEHACVDRSAVDCEEQNNAVRLNVRAAAILRETSDPSYVMPDLDNEDPNNPISDDARVAAMLHSLRTPKNTRTKRAALKTLGIPLAAEAIEKINVTLTDIICERIDGETVMIEALMNAILLTEAGCRDLSCGIPLLSLVCPVERDGEKDMSTNATMSATFANLIFGNSTLTNEGTSSNANSTQVRSNGTSSEPSATNIFGVGIFDASENNGNRNSDVSGATREQGEINGNSN